MLVALDISVLNSFVGKDLLAPEAWGEGPIRAGGGRRCALSPHLPAPGCVSMSPAPVLCPVPLADKVMRGPLGPLALPGLVWAKGIVQLMVGLSWNWTAGAWA